MHVSLGVWVCRKCELWVGTGNDGVIVGNVCVCVCVWVYVCVLYVCMPVCE